MSPTPIAAAQRKLITAFGFLRLRALREGVDLEQEIALIQDAAVALAEAVALTKADVQAALVDGRIVIREKAS